MIHMVIENKSLELFLHEKFGNNEKRITQYINEFLLMYLPHNDNTLFQEDKRRFEETKRNIDAGMIELLEEEEADREIEAFLDRL